MSTRRQLIPSFILFLALFCVVNKMPAQIPIGTFRDHLPYNGFHSIAVTPTSVYAATTSSLMCYTKSDESLSTISKVEGLSEAEISIIYYEPAHDYVVVAYQNADLDFIKDGKLANVSDIKNKSITGSKSVNSFFSHDNLLYVVCAFGIVSIDLNTLLVHDTWYTQTGNQRCVVNQMTIFDNDFYLVTDNGIYRSNVDNPALADFDSWQHIDEMGNTNFTIIQPFNNKIYAVKKGVSVDTLMVCNQQVWQYNDSISPMPIRSLAATDNELLLSSWNNIQVFDAQENMVYYSSWEHPFDWNDARDAKLDGTTIWIADNKNGL